MFLWHFFWVANKWEEPWNLAVGENDGSAILFCAFPPALWFSRFAVLSLKRQIQL